MSEEDDLAKRKFILDAAVRTFTSYGFKRTTMADIAEAAGMSRPALYLVFKNKEDIFRAGFVDLVTDLLGAMETALQNTAPLADRIIAAIMAGIITPFRAMLDTPHGAELFDAKQDHALDLAHDWFGRIEAMFALAIDRAVVAGSAHLPDGVSSSAIAHLLVSGIEGIKSRLMMTPEAEAELKLLVRMVIGPVEAVAAGQVK